MDRITIDRVRFCEEFSFAQYKRVNLVGYNFSADVAFKAFPYRWHTFVVVEGRFPADQNEFTIGYKAALRDGKGVPYAEATQAGSAKPPSPEPNNLLAAFETTWVVREPGSVEVTVLLDNEPVFVQQFKFMQGESACLAKPVPIETSRIVTEGDPNFACTLCECANKELTIIDCYARPSVLATVLKGVRPDVSIRLMTDPQFLQAYSTELPALRQVYPRIEVRFARDFHDRFLILDSSEHWHIGASLNGLDKRRVWHFQKLMKRDDVERLSKRLADAWNQAQTL